MAFLINERFFLEAKLNNDLVDFNQSSNLIIANRMHHDIKDVEEKVFTRDLFGSD